MNICAVLSQLNKHELALNHAMSAVILLQEMMLAKKLDPEAYPYDDYYDETEEGVVPETSKDRTAVLAIAYHNMGVEQEFLKSYPAAILSYKKAVNFAEKNLGADDGITQNLRSVYENAKVEVSYLTFFDQCCSWTNHCTRREDARQPRVLPARRATASTSPNTMR